MSAAPDLLTREHAAPGASSSVELAFEALDSAVAILDQHGVVETCNAAWQTWHANVFGQPFGVGDDLASLRPPDASTPGNLEQYLRHYERADAGERDVNVPDGRWSRLRIKTIGAGRRVAILDDVTSARRRERALEREAERLLAYARSSGDWHFELDQTLNYRERTAAGDPSDRSGHDESLGQGFLDSLRSQAVDAAEVEPIARCMAAREPFREFDVRLEADGEEQVVSLSGVPFVNEDGTFGGYRGSGRNVTAARRLARRLAYQASHDDLTGLANRRALETRITRILNGAAERSTPYALCFLDVDQIKVVNDTCGHGAGDALLNVVAGMLRDGLRGADTVARLGGDEFGVLLRGCNTEQAETVAEKIRKAIAGRPFTWDGQRFQVTVSIGVAFLDKSMQEAGELLRAADSACYAAKDRGRNRIKIYSLDDSTLNLRQGEMHWVARIHAALAESRFELRLQPIEPSAGADGSHLHYEVLLRMRGRDGREFSPGAFLPAAERYNLASQIDAWVLTETLAQLDRSPLFLDHLDTLAVNLSGQSLGEPAFLKHVEDLMSRHRSAARKLCFEITETAAISNLDRVQEFIQGMRRFGCTFALDDFGAGLSSFAYLRTLDVDFLKIDGMFVKDCHEDAIHRAMVKSINEVGRVMNKKTIAEFVENDAVRATLVAIGIDYVQGYGIGKPVTFDDVT